MAQRVVPLLVGGAVAVTSVVLLSGTPATATAKTVTVSFTADGPSPSSVTISPGDTVIYRNDVDPNGGGLLSAIPGAIKSVTVTVTNAAQSPFDLSPGEARPLTYTQPVATTYTGAYKTTLVLGLLPGGTATTTGRVTVKASSADSPPVVSPAAQPAPTTASAPSAGPGGGTGGQGGDQSGQQAQSTAQVPPQVNYTPRPTDAAAGQVPQGGSTDGQQAGDEPTPAAAAPGDDASTGSGDDAGASLPQIGSADQQQAATAEAMSRASHDSAAGSLGLPSIMAVVLLSMVSAGLVRTIMVRHGAHASLA